VRERHDVENLEGKFIRKKEFKHHKCKAIKKTRPGRKERNGTRQQKNKNKKCTNKRQLDGTTQQSPSH